MLTLNFCAKTRGKPLVYEIIWIFPGLRADLRPDRRREIADFNQHAMPFSALYKRNLIPYDDDARGAPPYCFYHFHDPASRHATEFLRWWRERLGARTFGDRTNMLCTLLHRYDLAGKIKYAWLPARYEGNFLVGMRGVSSRPIERLGHRKYSL